MVDKRPNLAPPEPPAWVLPTILATVALAGVFACVVLVYMKGGERRPETAPAWVAACAAAREAPTDANLLECLGW